MNDKGLTSRPVLRGNSRDAPFEQPDRSVRPHGRPEQPVRVAAGRATESDDTIVVEEPLEIRVAGDPIAVTMRTPGPLHSDEDARLALGFLYCEAILRSIDDVGTVSHCGRPGSDGYGNVIDVRPAAGAIFPLERLDASRRGTLTTAACGVCGRRRIDDLLAAIGPLAQSTRIKLSLIALGPRRLAETQRRFARTGGLHAACALTDDGEILASAEDIGRHNAVDKVVGALLSARAIGRAALLVVSGRASFEIVQKAHAARIGAVASVSAASSLAIDLATRAGIVLAAFVRDDAFNIYAGRDRLDWSETLAPSQLRR